MSKLAGLSLAVYLAAVCAVPQSAVAAEPDAVLATVGGDPITEADFQLYCTINNLPPEDQAAKRDKLLDSLIDRQLIRRHLARNKVAADPKLLAGQLAQIETLIRARKKDPDELLKQLGLTKPALEAEVGLTLAWQTYVQNTVTEAQLDEYFKKHQAELDGTKFRASQIILKTGKNPPAAEIAKRKAALSAIRKDVLAGKLSFAEAAKKFSESPSKTKGGDVGWFPFRGTQPDFFGDAAIRLKDGDISEPIVSPFGVHLIQITARQPGQLTLEDVRTEVVTLVAQNLWDQSIAAERMKSKVVVSGK